MRWLLPSKTERYSDVAVRGIFEAVRLSCLDLTCDIIRMSGFLILITTFCVDNLTSLPFS
jgi:hypothetical protein